MLSILALAAGMSLWALIGSVSTLPGTYQVSVSTATQCQDAADVMAALDRSRNGISLTCNSDTVARSVTR